MCHFKVVKYTGCGCELKLVMSLCTQGDGTGNCSGASRYERAVQSGVCGRSNCSYYEYQRPSGRWSFGSAPRHTPEFSIHADLDVHPKNPSPRPVPSFPAPDASPKPYVYESEDYDYANSSTHLLF